MSFGPAGGFGMSHIGGELWEHPDPQPRPPRWPLWLGLVLFVIGAVIAAPAALGHTGDTGIDYESWKIPGTNRSCCNNHDCAPTEAKWDAARKIWTAKFRGRWVDVPPARVLKFEAPDGNAHLCAMDTADFPDMGSEKTEIVVLCFTPPAAKY